MKKLLFAALLPLACLLSGCGPMLGALLSAGGTPPQAPATVTNISRTALDFALNSFDAALYGLDWAMDAGKLQPGSDQARKLAAAGRKVMNLLGVADAAQKLGSSPTYEEAFRNARTALDEFRQLLPAHASSLSAPRPPLTRAQRLAILDRLETGTPATI